MSVGSASGNGKEGVSGHIWQNGKDGPDAEGNVVENPSEGVVRGAR